ncbi:aminomethyltransferase family protein [Curtobacterium pusillum]|uniref:Aminomethyl transferase family protein n=1 Tax=Curtobacterium pusillum TaxID=69373 RepID=A0ABX2M8K9_9MICO|nr:aminomethyl transferase family protein [Curtobacterium pusillum]NUU13738.1 aminomethyl transferase family protein [Curtobacterium pusillum]GLK30680.1 glycine cleavage system protein T [Curtobacterium pusillum]
MATPSVQDGIDQAGSAINLLWKPGVSPWSVPVVAPEYAGWSAEQEAWRSGVALFDLSYHMFDTRIEGPDATRLLSDVSANNYEKFAVDQAKQFIPVANDGNIIVDGILLREAEDAYTLSGVPAAQNWVKYWGAEGGYDVAFDTDPDSSVRKDRDPELFRYQVQGPLAMEVVARAFGGPLPEIKFFHSQPVVLAGKHIRALRHGMAGQAGYEFIGRYEDHQAVKDALLAAGAPSGIEQVGGLAYFTNGIESGWIPTPTPAIYTDPALEDYRRSLSLFSYEGQKPLNGSFFSEDIEDYYLSPWELGYGRSVSFDHDFIGRDALLAAKSEVHRSRVTLVLNRDDVDRVFGGGLDFRLSYGRYRIEAKGELAGMTFWTATIGPLGTILALSVIEDAFAEPGSEVEVVWGEHPGAGTAADADLGFPRIRATVQPSPFDSFARTQYRANTAVA